MSKKKRTNAKPLSRKDCMVIFQNCLTQKLKRNAYAKANGLVPITLAVNFAKFGIPTVKIKDFGRKAENVIESLRSAARKKVAKKAVGKKVVASKSMPVEVADPAPKELAAA